MSALNEVKEKANLLANGALFPQRKQHQAPHFLFVSSGYCCSAFWINILPTIFSTRSICTMTGLYFQKGMLHR
jgi:hypothetical protein